jgi:hypothetical protein
MTQAWLAQSKQLVQKAAQSLPKTTPTTVDVSTVKAAPKGGTPTPQEQEKFQQQLAAAAAKPIKEATQNPNAHKQAFLDFIHNQLSTRESTTGYKVSLEDAEKAFPDLVQKLDLFLEQIIANADTPQEATAVQNYITHAIAGVQARAQDIRNKSLQGGGAGTLASSTNRLGADVDQTTKLAQIAQDLGGVDELIKAAKRGAGLP